MLLLPSQQSQIPRVLLGFSTNEMRYPVPDNQSRFAMGGPVFSLAILAIAVVAVMAMAHFR
jgi:hypothetical protein